MFLMPRCTMCGLKKVLMGAFLACPHCDRAHPTSPCCTTKDQFDYDGVGPNNRHQGGTR